MKRVPPDDRYPPQPQLEIHQPRRETNDQLLPIPVFTQIDLTKMEYPISRALWRGEISDLEN